MLVLSGSSGRDESDRARAIEDALGVTAVAWRWFGGPGLPAAISEVPLEQFAAPLDALADRVDHVAVLGTSKGAEAALLLGVHDPRVDAVVAVSPPAHVWSNVGAGSDPPARPHRSSFTVGGEPLPFVATDDAWEPPPGERPALRGLYEQSLAGCVDPAAARIPVERIAGPVVVSAGGDDRVWPSDVWVEQIGHARGDLPTAVVLEPAAGHQVVLPGERPRAAGRLEPGGTPHADARVGERLRDATADLLGLRPRG